MKTIFSPIFFFFVCIASIASAEPSYSVSPIIKYKIQTPEETYFKTRNGFTRSLENAPYDENKHQKSLILLEKLEKQLLSIIGPINIKGFPKKGKINLETLEHGFGFGQMDGMRFNTEKESLVVTTEPLLKIYLRDHQSLPKNYNCLSKTEELYHLTFHINSRVTCYAEIPVKSANNQCLVYAFLGINAQDIGPFKPTEIYVFVKKETHILMVYAPTIIEIPEIQKCKKVWKEVDTETEYEQQFEDYRHCYENEAKNQPFFKTIKRQAQSIVDRLVSG